MIGNSPSMQIVWVGAFLGLVAAVSGPASGQAPAVKQKSASVTATLYRVESGLFDAELGKVMDLTDRQVLFKWFLRDESAENLKKKKYIRVQLNNKEIELNPGARLDLKNMYELKGDLEGKSRCLLDFIDAAFPNGGAAIATFRLNCR